MAIRESTCPAIHAALQAAEKGVPFMPLRGLIGSDLLKVRPDWQVIDNPLADGGGDPIVPAAGAQARCRALPTRPSRTSTATSGSARAASS